MTMRFDEHRIKNIIRNVINEAYGTPPEDDRVYYDDLYDLKNGNDFLPSLFKRLKGLYSEISDYCDFEDRGKSLKNDKDFQEVIHAIRMAILYTERVVKNEKMKLGLQPDNFYNRRHSSTEWQRGHGSEYSTHKAAETPWSY